MGISSYLHNAYLRRKYSENVKAFIALIKTPLILAGSPAQFTMRAPARVAVSAAAPFANGQLTLGGAQILGTGANVISRGPYLYEDEACIFTSSVAGTFKIYILDEWRLPKQVATVTV